MNSDFDHLMFLIVTVGWGSLYQLLQVPVDSYTCFHVQLHVLPSKY